MSEKNIVEINKSSEKQPASEKRHAKGLGRGIYILPNLFTSASLFSAFYSIIATFNGNYFYGGIAIIFSIFFDGIDGKVARLTHTTSAFGVEYDSLSDLVAFGVAPAFLAYSIALSSFGRLGWVIAFIYVACAAIRLARFNIQIDTVEKSMFNGLPSPAAAGLVTTTILLYITPSSGLDESKKALFASVIKHPLDIILNKPIDFLLSQHFTILVLVLVSGLLMISTIKYKSFKNTDMIKEKPVSFLLFAIIMMSLLVLEPIKMLFAIFIIYTASGLITLLLPRRGEKKLTN
ncbi:MAG: CDP-diacylglycerol--serine O-phosphatidyltransferase [bacterium]